MDPNQMAEAERLAAEWEPNTDDCFESDETPAGK
jgi:hypothetical protein